MLEKFELRKVIKKVKRIFYFFACKMRSLKRIKKNSLEHLNVISRNKKCHYGY